MVQMYRSIFPPASALPLAPVPNRATTAKQIERQSGRQRRAAPPDGSIKTVSFLRKFQALKFLHPASLDIAKLAQIGLEFTGMTADEAAKFTSTVDWTSTLVVPIPKNAASNQQVTVDGVTGTLIERPSDDAPQFALFWIKDGIIYTIGGLGSNSQQRPRDRKLSSVVDIPVIARRAFPDEATLHEMLLCRLEDCFVAHCRSLLAMTEWNLNHCD